MVHAEVWIQAQILGTQPIPPEFYSELRNFAFLGLPCVMAIAHILGTRAEATPSGVPNGRRGDRFSFGDPLYPTHNQCSQNLTAGVCIAWIDGSWRVTDCP